MIASVMRIFTIGMGFHCIPITIAPGSDFFTIVRTIFNNINEIVHYNRLPEDHRIIEVLSRLTEKKIPRRPFILSEYIFYVKERKDRKTEQCKWALFGG